MTGFLPHARKWSWLAALGAGVLLIGVYFSMVPGSTEQSRIYEVIGLAAVAAAIVAVLLHDPRGKAPWILIAAGQLAFVVGDFVWAMYAEQGISPFPSFADAAYLAGYPLIAAGLALAVRRRIAGGDRASLLDAAILTTGAATVWWAVVLGPQAAAADPEPLSFAISAAYPIGDLMLLGLALTLAVTPGARGRRSGCSSAVSSWS